MERKTGRRDRPAPLERRGLLDAHQKDDMLAAAIRNREVFDTVSAALTVDRVRAISDGYALVWQVVREFDEKFDELPTQSQIEDALHRKLDGAPGLLSPEECEEVDEFLDFAWDDAHHGKNLARSKGHAKAAIANCKLFLGEAAALRYRETVARDNTIVADLPALLERHQEELAEAEMLATPGKMELFPAGWDEAAALDLRPLEVAAMDTFLGGGLAGGEVLVFMAPYGSCKTLVGVQAACMAALRAANRAPARGKKGRRQVVFLISTEMDLAEFRIRALMCLAQVPYERIQEVLRPGVGIKALSRSAEPGTTPETKYEKAKFRGRRRDGFQCEHRRVTQAMAVLENHLIFCDCTDANPDRPKFKGGATREIRAWIKGILRADKAIEPALFVLDHASALAAREIEATGKNTEETRHILKRIPLDAGEFFAKPYGVPFLVLHQLSGDANSRGPAADLHHTDAAEAKAFAEYADFAVVCGRPTEDEDQIARWRMTKHRRQPPKAHAFVKIMGRFGRVVDVTSKYTIAPGSRSIIPVDAVKHVDRHRAQVETRNEELA